MAFGLEQVTTRAAPFMGQLIAFTHIAEGTGYHNIGRVIGATTGKWDNVIDVPFRQFLMTPVTLAFLTLVLTTNISNGKRASSSLFPCAAVPAGHPAIFRHLLRVGIPIVPMVRPYPLAVSFHISPLFLNVGVVVFSALAPYLFCMAFAICLFACPNSVKVLQSLLAMIGLKFFNTGFSIESEAIFTFSAQSILPSLMRVKILLGSGLLLLAPRAPFISLRSRAVSLGIGFRFSRWLFAAFSRLTQFAVACQTSFLASICIEVFKGRRKIVMAFRTMLQWYNIIHGKAYPLSSWLRRVSARAELLSFLVESL